MNNQHVARTKLRRVGRKRNCMAFTCVHALPENIFLTANFSKYNALRYIMAAFLLRDTG